MKSRVAGLRRKVATHMMHRPPELDAEVDHFLSTVCDRSRRYILELLAKPRDDMGPPKVYERRSGEIADTLGLSSSTTSEHLRQLLDIHLVVARKAGNTTYYQLSNHALVRAFQDLMEGLDTHYR